MSIEPDPIEHAYASLTDDLGEVLDIERGLREVRNSNDPEDNTPPEE